MLLYVNPLSAPQAIQPGMKASGVGVTGAMGASSAKEQKALKELEHYFAFTLLQEMRKSVPKTDLLDGGQAQSMYEEMLDDAMSGNMAESRPFGVSHMLEQQLRIAELQKKIHGSGGSALTASAHSKATALGSIK